MPRDKYLPPCQLSPALHLPIIPRLTAPASGGASPLPRAPRERMNTEPSAVPRESLTLVEHGLFPIRIHANLTPPALLEHALRRGEGQLTDHGAFAAVTSPHTGRSPKDKFIGEEHG